MQPLALAAVLAASLAFAAPALADSPPPADAQPLSTILQGLEQEAGFGYFDEIEWDDDGYWEVTYVTSDGRKVEVELDPVTGAPR